MIVQSNEAILNQSRLCGSGRNLLMYRDCESGRGNKISQARGGNHWLYHRANFSFMGRCRLGRIVSTSL